MDRNNEDGRRFLNDSDRNTRNSSARSKNESGTNSNGKFNTHAYGARDEEPIHGYEFIDVGLDTDIPVTFVKEDEKVDFAGEVHNQTENVRNADDYEDIQSYSKPSKGFYDRKLMPFLTKNNKKNLKTILAALFSSLGIILIVLTVIYGSTVFNILKSIFDIGIDSPDKSYGEKDATFETEDFEDEKYSNMYDVNASSLNEMLRAWAKNGGEKMSSKYVINVLLIGADSMEVTRSDTIMIASINIKTKEIILTSIMRDCYTYVEIDGEDRYAKINASCNWGGPAALIDTIENNLKIEIDKYVCVDFSSFPKVIDAVGGIEVPITKKEANFINTKTRYTVQSGNAVHLNGNVALTFSRIRKLDGDDQRTRRQRLVIMALINKVKSSSLTDLDDIVAAITPNIRTNYTKKQILSLGTKALSDGWANFKIKQYLSPLTAKDESGHEITGKGVYMKIPVWYPGNQFVWIVDYPTEAQRIQTAIYGTSNIVLEDDRTSAFEHMVVNTTSSSYQNNNTTASTTVQTTTDSYWTEPDWSNGSDYSEEPSTNNGWPSWWPTRGDNTSSSEDPSGSSQGDTTGAGDGTTGPEQTTGADEQSTTLPDNTVLQDANQN